MTVTQNTYTGNGSNQNFVFTFSYLDRSHVKAKINGTLTTEFTFFNDSTLRFNTAPANGASVLIYRETPSDNLLADYTAGSAIREVDLELTLQQVLNVAQETETFAENQSTTGLQEQINTANTNASNAVVVANAAAATANGFASQINTANTNASDAVTTANTANTNASNAATTANNAATTANNAVTTANSALPKAGGTMTGNINFVATQPLTGVSLNGGSLNGMRNRIINGDFSVNQRNNNAIVSLTGGTSLSWVCDRWNVVNTGNTSAVNFQVVPDGPPGFVRSIQAQIVTPKVPTAADYVFIRQPIEGSLLIDFQSGTGSSKSFVLSFWAKASVTGTYGGHVRWSNGTNFRTWAFTYTISTANTWQRYSIPITGETTLPPQSGNLEAMSVLFDLGSGSTSTTSSANQWVSGNFLRPNTAVQLVTTSGATFNVAGIQLELGTQPTEYETRGVGNETQLCLRYFERMFARLGGYNVGGNSSYINIPFKAPKRAIPTMGWNSISAGNLSSGFEQSQTIDEFLHFCVIAVTGSFEWSSSVVADAEL